MEGEIAQGVAGDVGAGGVGRPAEPAVLLQQEHIDGQLKEQNITAKVMVGGAALTPEYAEEAGADYYASDGVVALNIANEIIGSK